MPEQSAYRESATDAAALAGGAVAVAASLFVAPGPFSIVSFAFGVTLAVIILGYTWKHLRWWLQSVAVAAALGLALLPVVGCVLETSRARDPMQFLRLGAWECGKGPCNAKCEPESQVTPFELVSAWLFVLIAFYLIDDDAQKRRARRPTAPA